MIKITREDLKEWLITNIDRVVANADFDYDNIISEDISGNIMLIPVVRVDINIDVSEIAKYDQPSN